MRARASELSEALAAIRRAIPANSPAEAMNLVACHVQDGQAQISARNAHLAAIATCPCEGQDEEFNLSKDAIEAIHSIARRDPASTVNVASCQRKHVRRIELPDTSVTQQHYDEVTVQAQGSRFKFEVFHAPPQSPNPPSMSACLRFQPEPLRDVFSLLRDVHDDTFGAANLTGISLSGPQDGLVTATAADGRRIGIITVSAEGTLPDVSSTVIPHRLAAAVIPLLANHEGTVEIGFSPNQCGIRAGNVLYYGQLDTRPFPSLVKRLDKMDRVGKRVGSVDRTMLKQAMELARVTTNPSLNVVDVTIESHEGCLRFSSKSPDVGQSVITPPIGIQEGLRIRVDPSYVIPVLSRVRDQEVQIDVDASESIQFSTPSLRYMLMGIDRGVIESSS